MTRSFPGGAGLGQVELPQLPGWEGQPVQLRQLVVLQFPLQFEQLRQLFQQLLAQMLFLGDAVDTRAHDGGDEGVVQLVQLDSDLGLLLQHGDDQLQLGWGHLLLPPWS